MKTHFEKRAINPARLCFGLANIGYKSYAAVEDIIDNSVTAGARNIDICIITHGSKALTEKGSIDRIRMTDDGKGMDNEIIRKALDIGSDIDYQEHSLSKYGLGLKSAGLSLGDRIQVYSKTVKQGFSDCLTLDLTTIREENEYGVMVSTISESQRKVLEGLDHGTVVDISEVTSGDTVNALKNKLIDRLGVLYYEFIKDNIPLKITLHVRDNKFEIASKDILHREISDDHFDAYHYECKKPCRLLIDKEITIPDAPDKTPPVIVNLTTFPQASMAKFSGFTKEEQDLIKYYGVSSTNSGFFIYRNRRLIRWADNLGIVDRDLRTLRGRIDISTEHDELLNVDVSKQNLELPEKFLDSLALLCRIPKANAKKAYDLCSVKLSNNDDKEGESASDSVIDIVEEDPGTHVEPIDEKDKAKRREKIISETGELPDTAPNSTETDVKIRKVVYKDYLHTSNLWDFRLDPEYGTIVHINKSHPFYQLVLINLDAADPQRQAIECFIYCLAVGEVKTRENLQQVDYKEIQHVMTRYNQTVSWNLMNWTAHNQNLFD
jgi:hypothetical protein